jgi:hypothetical protein
MASHCGDQKGGVLEEWEGRGCGVDHGEGVGVR